MKIHRAGSRPSQGPNPDYFTGTGVKGALSRAFFTISVPFISGML